MTFTKVGDVWVGEYTSAGKTLVELERTKTGIVGAYVKVTGATNFAGIGGDIFDANAAFVVDVPSGATVKIISHTEVTKASTLAYE